MYIRFLWPKCKAGLELDLMFFEALKTMPQLADIYTLKVIGLTSIKPVCFHAGRLHSLDIYVLSSQCRLHLKLPYYLPYKLSITLL
jgi:hypothetical protein